MGTGYPAQTYKNLADAGLAAQRLRAYWATDVYRIAPFKTCTATTTTLVWNGNGNECLDTTALFDNQRTVVGPGPPNGPKYYTSVALYAPEWTYFGNLLDHPGVGVRRAAPRAGARACRRRCPLGWCRRQLLRAELRRTGTSNAASALIAPRSVVGTLPFVTSFNEGEGDVYAVGGNLVADTPWNDLSGQDVLPTWICTLSGDLNAVPVYGSSSNGEAFNGGSALALTGQGAGELALYQTQIPVPAGSRLTVAFEAKTSSGPLPYLRLHFADGTTATVKGSGGSGWNDTVGSVQGARAPSCGSRSVSMAAEPCTPRWVNCGSTMRPLTKNRRQSRSPRTGASISWTQPPKPPIAYWNVYSNAGSCLDFLGPAFTTSYDVSQRMFSTVKPTTRFVVQPVSTNGSAATIGIVCPNGS